MIKIGMTQMEFWKMFEIDFIEDLRMCKTWSEGIFAESLRSKEKL